MREADMVRKIKMELKARYGVECVKHYGSPYSEKGTADLLCAVPQPRGTAAFAAFEVKVGPRSKPTPSQLAWIERYRRAGALATVVHSVDEAEQALARAGLILHDLSRLSPEEAARVMKLDNDV